MRYIGNKSKLLTEIESFVYGNAGRDFTTFCDLFSGTGSVGAIFADNHTILANDILRSAYILTQAQLNQPTDTAFPSLTVDPFDLFNDASNRTVGFIARNYAPKRSERMYFSDENAERIDFIRTQIETWRFESLLTDSEYYYLLACLLEAVSKVANVAGVYGSYLKSWDPRALKPLRFAALPLRAPTAHVNEVTNEDSLSLIQRLQGDVLYLDPPYTKNDYSVQYHLLETIARYDEPEIKGKTGGRHDTKKSKFSTISEAHAAFEQIVAEANFKHVVVSYSNKGLLEAEFIERCMRKYAVEGTFTMKVVAHRNYTNMKSLRDTSLEEYLFYIEKAPHTFMESPLNYMGSKFNIVPEIIAFSNYTPTTFVDVFGGGFNVGINTNATNIVYNDLNHFVRGLIETFYVRPGAELLAYILKTVKRYGLEKKNKETFVQFRTKYNATPPAKRSLMDLYVLLQFGFQQQFRFNSKHEFNNTVGMSGFNSNTIIKLLGFSRLIKTKNVSFHSVDFEEILNTSYDDAIYYCDPPYLITLGSYNDGKRGFNGWTEDDERRLYRKLDELDANGQKFILSNVLTHKERTNDILDSWLKARQYHHKELQYKNRSEIIVKNYQ